MPGRKSADATAVARSTENGDETAPAKAAKNASDVGVEVVQIEYRWIRSLLIHDLGP